MAAIRAFAALLVLLISAPAHGQAVLTADLPFSYTFTSLQATTVIPGGHVDGHSDGQLRLSLSQFDPGDQMRIEMFESSTAGVPFYPPSGTECPAQLFSPAPGMTCKAPYSSRC